MSEEKKNIKITSRKNGGWRRLKVKIEAAEITDDAAKTDPEDKNYRIAREEWDKTLGPIFNAVSDSIHNNNISKPAAEAAAAGYNAMKGGSIMYDYDEHKAFHQLATAFGVAAKPERLDYYKLETPEDGRTYNSYGESLRKFAAALNGEDQAVVVTRSQLSALANIAKASADYAFKSLQQDQSPEAKQVRDFYRANIVNNPKFSY